MFDAGILWKERLSRWSKELSRYFRYIFNGHFVIVLVFLIGGGAYYYQEWVKGLPADYPVPFIMAALIAILLTYSPIFTFLTEADRIFLLPLETRLGSYFKRSWIVSFVIQAYLLLLGLGVMIPMYAQVNGDGARSFLHLFGVLLIAKALNMLIKWRMQYYIEQRVHLLDPVVRFCVNAVLIYLLVSQASYIFVLPTVVLLAALLLIFYMKTKEKGLKWELLIELEERRMNAFYRLANMFTDVPKLKDRVKRRRWLDWLLARLPYSQEATFKHLYMRTFLRAGDYFGLFMRLSIIGWLVLYFVSFGYGQIGLAVLFLYLTGFQLLPLWSHHQHKLWISLYPVQQSLREHAFKQLLVNVLYVQTVIFASAVLIKGEYVTGAGVLAAGALFSNWYAKIYIQKKLH